MNRHSPLPHPSIRSPRNEPWRIAAVGTSLTEAGGWIDPLRVALERASGRSVRFAVVARPGATSRWIAQQTRALIAFRPDVVLLEASINDAALHRRITMRESRRNLHHLVNALRSWLPRVTIVVMVMNGVSGWRGWLRPRYDRYGDMHVREALRLDAGVLDHRPMWAGLSRKERAAAIPDGIHPVPTAAAAIIVPRVVAQLLPQASAHPRGDGTA